MDRMPSTAKKRLSRQKYKKQLLSSSQKTKSTQTGGSANADRIEQGRQTKFELDLIKILGCFLVGHGIYTNNLVFSNIKFLYTNHFLNYKKIPMNQMEVQMILSFEENSIAIRAAKTKDRLPNVRQTNATHSKNFVLHQAVVIFQQVGLSFDVGNTLAIVQRESEKTL